MLNVFDYPHKYSWGGFIWLALCLAALPLAAQNGSVLQENKISSTQGNFPVALADDEKFGLSLARLGDLNHDGTEDLAVGSNAPTDFKGAVWILFLDPAGQVSSHQQITEATGGFGGTLALLDFFGTSVAAIGDLDNDDIPELAVGAAGDNDGQSDAGAVWILFLDPNGMVKQEQKISATAGNFTGILDAADNFGSALAPVGDLDGDGIPDLAVGALGDDDGGSGRGAVWILFLNADGTVKGHQKISDTDGNFNGILADGDNLGRALGCLGDMNSDNVNELAVGAWKADSGPGDDNQGAVWLLFLDPNGMVNSEQKISATAGNFTGTLDDSDHFGRSISCLDDLDGDGIGDLAVGALNDDDGGPNRGAAWILFLNANGTVKGHQKISNTAGSFAGILDDQDQFGIAVAGMGDIDGDSITDLAVGAWGDDDGLEDAGAVWTLFLDGQPLCRYRIDGDVNGDCLVNLVDFALMTGNWLLDCFATPADPACMPI